MIDQQYYPTPFAYPVYVMAKPAGPGCNLACDYCYYLDKADLYQARGVKNMTDATLERYIRSYIESQTLPAVQFTWHGGETMLRPVSFYKRAIELQQRYAGGRRVENCIQTNGTLLTDEWCRFLRDNGWLVGLSIDGPQEFHDEYRRARDGKPTFHRVMRAVDMLNRYGVDWNAMAVVNDYNADYPDEFYNFFKQIGCRYIQFTPVVERLTADGHIAAVSSPGELAPFSVTPAQWGDFLCRVFDLWVKSDVGETFVQIFDATLANYVGVEPGVCTLASVCGHAGVMEHNGDVYCCDHFVFPEYLLGNIHDATIAEMMYSERERAFGAAKKTALPDQCKQCQFLKLCNGECPRNRFCLTADGQPGLNYLCEGYRQFFAHSAPYFQFMAEELRNQRPPSNVMKAIISQGTVTLK